MLRQAFVITIAAAALAVTAFAQNNPDFSGTWKVNVSKSDFGPLPPPTSRIDKISQTASGIKEDVDEDGAQGKQVYTLNYPTDGTEVTNTPAPGMDIKSKANFDAATLVISSKLNFQGSDVDIKSVWSLSPDGKTLTVASHLNITGMGELDTKYIFDKAGDAVAASAAAPAKPAPITASVSGARPDYSGTWKLNVAKSDFGPAPAPESQVDTIVLDGPSLKISTNQEGAQGKMKYDVQLTTDGKEVAYHVGDREIKAAAQWDGGLLVVNRKLNVNDMDIALKDTWTLASDGKTLNHSVHITTAMGEFDQKIIFEKQ